MGVQKRGRRPQHARRRLIAAARTLHSRLQSRLQSGAVDRRLAAVAGWRVVVARYGDRHRKSAVCWLERRGEARACLLIARQVNLRVLCFSFAACQSALCALAFACAKDSCARPRVFSARSRRSSRNKTLYRKNFLFGRRQNSSRMSNARSAAALQHSRAHSLVALRRR